jgi:hypothetical protein
MPTAKNSAVPPTEREKWAAECAFRERELKVAEEESRRKSEELALRVREQEQSRWRSPLFIAVGAAIVAALGNAGIAYTNGISSRDLEERKSEQARILEMIKTDDTEVAANNLEFLLKAGLITDARRRGDLERYLRERPRGGGPVLPSSGLPVSQRPTSSLRVGVFYCESAGAEARRRAEQAMALQTSQGGTWTIQELSSATNRQPAYRADGNEIRYNADEDTAATNLQQGLQTAVDVEFERLLSLNYTRGYISVFFCEGASDIPPGEAPPDASNMTL